MPRHFPLGTSRLHEALETQPDHAAFPRLGYFHSSSQMKDVVDLLLGLKPITLEEARYVFRKDQTAHNPFDLRLWTEEFPLALEHARSMLAESEHVIMEISSPRSYRWRDWHVQGNPNSLKDVPYSEVWRDGYYATHDPAAAVRVFEDTNDIAQNLRAVGTRLRALGKTLTLMGHLVDPGNPNRVRLANNRALADAASSNADLGVRYFDASPWVGQHGFRVLANGTSDIHHLPHAAYPSLHAALTSP